MMNDGEESGSGADVDGRYQAFRDLSEGLYDIDTRQHACWGGH